MIQIRNLEDFAKAKERGKLIGSTPVRVKGFGQGVLLREENNLKNHEMIILMQDVESHDIYRYKFILEKNKVGYYEISEAEPRDFFIYHETMRVKK